jgi:outer membrane phospholipase A
LNTLYFSPTLVFGQKRGFQFAINPRVWAYLPDLDDNPDLENYRGYVDLRTRIGWSHGLQLAATGRLGDDGNRGSVQLDLTCPIMQFVYLHVQYFTGYGESLLYYHERGSSLRAGFALYR